MKLRDATWPEVAAVADRSLLAVPLGSTEQHGPHLPLSVDADIAVALADHLERARDDVVVAPALVYGASGEHAGFPGTLSLGLAATETAILELVRSADAFAGVVLVSAHGGNAEALARATTRLGDEGRRVLAWSPPLADGDAHAGRTETSLLLALDSVRVRRDRVAVGNTTPLAELMGSLRAGGVAAVSANGVLGDPTGASAAEGERLLAAAAAALVAAVADWCANLTP